MINNDSRLSLFSEIKSTVFTGIKSSLIWILSVVIVFQFLLLSSAVSASPLATSGTQADKVTAKQAVKDSKQARKEMKNNYNEMTKDMKSGQVDKVVDMETDCAKQMGGCEK